MNKKILVVAAHPDDEVLGCGGTIAKFAKQGAEIHVMFLADGASSRDGSTLTLQDELKVRRAAAKKACNVLGVKSVSFDNFPDNQMDSVVLLDIVKVIESTISKYKPEMIFTHHSGDLNVDHRVVNKAVVTACRPLANNSVKTVLFYEIPSSTEWQIPSAYPVFTPNWFVDISVELVCKIEALQAYRDELRSWPHPRSVKGVEYLAHWRGATISVDAAEAFVLGRMLS